MTTSLSKSLSRRSFIGGLASSVSVATATSTAGHVNPVVVKQGPSLYSTRSDFEKVANQASRKYRLFTRLLGQRCRRHIRTLAELSLSYSGCTLEKYVQRFTYEERGAARAASDLATFGFLCQLNPALEPNFGGDLFLRAAKAILLSWSRTGFRYQGALRTRLEDFCNSHNKSDRDVRFGIGLQVGRGLPHILNSVDILLATDSLTRVEFNEIDQFINYLANLTFIASNYRAAESQLDCNRFSNHASSQIFSLMSVAKFYGRAQQLSCLGSLDCSEFIIPWKKQVRNAIYGFQGITMSCFKNDNGGLFYQTDNPTPGEIVDRYRNLPHQTFGYTMYSLSLILSGSMILSNYNFDCCSGIEGELISLSLGYYSVYFKNFLSDSKNYVPMDFVYPSSANYWGKLISGDSGATIECADGLTLPFLLAVHKWRHVAGVTDVFDAAERFRPNYEPFSRVDCIHIRSLVEYQSV